MRGATYDHPNWGAAWRQYDLDLVKSAQFRDFLKAQGFVLVTWADLAKAERNVTTKTDVTARAQSTSTSTATMTPRSDGRARPRRWRDGGRRERGDRSRSGERAPELDDAHERSDRALAADGTRRR